MNRSLAFLVLAVVVSSAHRATAQEPTPVPTPPSPASDAGAAPLPAAPAETPPPPPLPTPPAPAVAPTEPTPPPAVVPHEDAKPPVATVAKDGHPLAGRHGGLFYLRDANDDFRLYLQGRAQVDFYSYFGPGVDSTALKPTLFLRRVRPELSGELFGRWAFMLAGDFGATALDNPRGTVQTSAAAPGAAPTATTARYNGADTARISAAPTDVYLAYRAHPMASVQVGQFDAPFTMENRTSDKVLPFMERSLAVRAVGIPTNKELGIMFSGETPSHHWNYAVGIFNGDGQNRPNTDGRFDAMARTYVKPLASEKDTLKDLQIGGSARTGSRDPATVTYDYPTMTTQGNYAFWSPTYTSSKGPTHVLPAGGQLGLAAELRVPFSIVDLQSELVYIRNETRETREGFQTTATEREGVMSGYSYYVQLGIWALGKRDIRGLPGVSNPPHVDFAKADPAQAPQALEFLAKWEQLHLTYESARLGGAPDAKGIDGDIKVNTLSFGANYWATKHVRLSLNYVMDMFPGSAPGSALQSNGSPVWTTSQRAQAPGNTLGKGINDGARDNAHELHELLARVAVGF